MRCGLSQSEGTPMRFEAPSVSSQLYERLLMSVLRACLLPRQHARLLERMQTPVLQGGGSGAGKLLAGVGDAQRVERGAQAHHAVDLVRVEHHGQIVELLDADAVLAGDGAAHLNAQLQDAASQGFGPLKGARLTAIDRKSTRLNSS